MLNTNVHVLKYSLNNSKTDSGTREFTFPPKMGLSAYKWPLSYELVVKSSKFLFADSVFVSPIRLYVLLRAVGLSGGLDHRLLSKEFSGGFIITHILSYETDRKAPQKTHTSHQRK